MPPKNPSSPNFTLHKNSTTFEPPGPPPATRSTYFTRDDVLDDVTQFLDQRNYGNIFDIALRYLEKHAATNDTHIESFLSQDGALKFLNLCLASPAFSMSTEFADRVCNLAFRLLQDEFENLVKTISQEPAASSLSVQALTTFSYDNLWNQYHSSAPRATSFFMNLVQSTFKVGQTNDRAASQPSQTPSSTQAESPLLPNPAIISAISALCNVRSQRANTFQSHLGYFLYASKTPKRVIDVLHHHRFCVSYGTVRNMVKSVAKHSRQDLKEWAGLFPPHFVSFDNMNFYGRVRDQRLDNSSELLNYTAGFVGMNPETHRTAMFTRDHVNRFEIKNLDYSNFLLDDSELKHLKHVFRAGPNRTLSEYFRKHLERYRDPRNDSPLEFFKVPAIHPLPPQKSRIATLPAFDKDEAKISEITEIIREIQAELGYDVEAFVLGNYLVMFCGDYLTVRNIRSAVVRQAECAFDPSRKLGYIETSAGLFHLQMQVISMLLQTHFGSGSREFGLSRWLALLHRNPNMWNPKNGKLKDFRSCHGFFSNVFDGYLIAAIATQFRVKTWPELEDVLEKRNWRKAIKVVSNDIRDFDLVAGWREEPKEERDIVRENAFLFLQHGIVYNEFCEAMRYGDSGRVERCLRLFCIWFQATRQTNYAMETIHMVACLRKVWSPELREYWMDNCLLNLSGSGDGFLACDLVGEHVVREIKSMVHHNVNPATDEFLRYDIAVQVLVFAESRENIRRNCGAIDFGNHSSTVAADRDVRAVAETVLHGDIFQFSSSRGSQEKEFRDLYTDGLAKLMRGKPIADYKERMNNDMCMYDEKEVSDIREPVSVQSEFSEGEQADLSDGAHTDGEMSD